MYPYWALPTARVSAGPSTAECPSRNIETDVEVATINGKVVSIKFLTDGPERKTQYEVTLFKDDISALIESIADNVPGLTEMFANCLTAIVKKNNARLATIAEKMKGMEMHRAEKQAVDALLSDANPEKP